MSYDKTIYADVWASMDACNASGLIETWQRKWLPYLREEVRAAGGGTDALNRHPVNLIVADKLLQLGGIHITDEKLQKAYDTVLERSA